jgi:hypothetical protein
MNIDEKMKKIEVPKKVDKRREQAKINLVHARKKKLEYIKIHLVMIMIVHQVRK